MTTNRLIEAAAALPSPAPRLTLSYSPLRLDRDGLPPLELRLTAPAEGERLPIILLSHGYGPSFYLPSKDGYAPLAQFWAERGFAVIQPTHASSRVGGLPSDKPGAPFFWRERVTELRLILDRLQDVAHQAPGLEGRLDPARIAAVGHSFGGHTVSLLLGATLDGETFRDPRITAGVLLAAPGRGGADLLPESAARFPFFDLDFGGIAAPSLVVCGSEDASHFTTRGPDWHVDPYRDAAGSSALLMLTGAGHGLGGIAGLDAKETETESPDMLEATKRMTLAWLQTVLRLDPSAWSAARDALRAKAPALGTVEERPAA